MYVQGVHRRSLTRRDEDIFERALRRMQILEPDARLGQVLQQRGDAGSLACVS